MERDQCKSHRNEIREKPRNHINKESIKVVLRDDNAIYWDSPIVKGFLLFERKGKIALSSCKNTPTLEDFILTTLINSNRDITKQSNALTEIHRPFRWRCYTKRKDHGKSIEWKISTEFRSQRRSEINALSANSDRLPWKSHYRSEEIFERR